MVNEGVTQTLTATDAKAQVRSLAAQALCALGASAGYYIAALIGTLLTVPPAGFAVIWPATAVLISVMLISPQRRWWMFLIGIVPAHLLLTAQFQAQAPFHVVATQIAGNILVARLTVAALHATMGKPVRFDTLRRAIIFIAVTVIAAATGNAAVLTFHWISGWAEDFWLSWRQWMLACIFPSLVLPPLLALARDHHLAGYYSEDSRRSLIELGIVSATTFALCQIAFSWHIGPSWWPILILLPLPLLLWSSVRLGVGGTCFTLATLGASLLMCAAEGRGPFAQNASIDHVVALQTYLIVMAMPFILLAALMEEWRRAEGALRLSQSRMAVVAAATDTGLWQWDEKASTLWMTEHCRAILGFTPDDEITLEKFLALVHEDDRARVSEAAQFMINSGDVEALHEFRITRPDGETRWFAARTHSLFERPGQLLRISGVMRDITPRKQSQLEAEALTGKLLTLQEEERENIAMELHDSTTQHLVAAGLSLGMLKRRMSAEEAGQKAVDDMTASLSHAINELRMFTYLLRPAGLGRDTLSGVARRYVEGFAQRGDLVARFKADPRVDTLPIEKQRSLLRIIQEGLMNVHRHAGAMRVSVVMKCVGDRLTLIIGDDGNGVLPRPVRRETEGTDLGLGIPGMRVRTQQLGGALKVRSTPRATTVVIVIPYNGA